MTALQIQNDPATAPTVPGHGSNIPHEETKMNEATNNTAPAENPDWTEDELLQLREAAAISWTQWDNPNDKDAWQPPTNEQWIAAVDPHLFMIRLAFASMFKTREETMELLKGLEDEDMFEETVDGFAHAIQFLTPILSVLKSAEARFIVAGATLSLERAGEPT